MTIFKVGVCESPAELTSESGDWSRLCTSVAAEAPHLFLLNEMPFGPWIASGDSFEERRWIASCSAHDAGMKRVEGLGALCVAGSRPMQSGALHTNAGFLWSRHDESQWVHTKQYFPDEQGYYEARWFEPGERHFRVAAAGTLRVGFLICTELMFNEHARQYGREGAHVILVPRAVGSGSLERWLVAMRMAAIVSGCYVISSNRAGTANDGQVFGGRGWIIDPFGEVIAETSTSLPVAFHDIDTTLVAQAQSEYPCYVR
jgi:N-carbamoylputrescine amidase